MGGPERRKDARKETKLFVDINDPTLNENVGRGIMVDVSKSGFALETDSDLVTNKQYIFTVEIPVKITATVVREVVPGQWKQFGMRFTGQGFMDKLVLKRLLKGELKSRKVR